MKDVSPTRKSAAKTIYAALQILYENGGEMKASDVIDEVEKRVDFSDWELERYENTGHVRWKTVLRFFTIDCVKAGLLVKRSGTWYLTPEGEAALSLSEKELLDKATAAYREWKLKRDETAVEDVEEPEERPGEEEETIKLEENEEQGKESFSRYIKKLGAYEFQDLTAALFRGMGYFTPFVAP